MNSFSLMIEGYGADVCVCALYVCMCVCGHTGAPPVGKFIGLLVF